MYFLKFFYAFRDKLNDKKFRTIFISSIAAAVLIIGAVIAAVIVLGGKDADDNISDDSEALKDSVYINGIDVSGKSIDELKKLFKDMAKDYELSVSFDGEKIGDIDGKSIDYAFNENCVLEDFIENASSDISESDNNIVISDLWIYDEEKLSVEVSDIVSSLGGYEITRENVTLEYSAENGYFFAAAEAGRFVDNAAVDLMFENALTMALSELSLDEAVTDSEGKGSVINGDERLSAITDELNSYMNSVLNYEFNSNTVVIDKSRLSSWFYIDDDFNICVDEDALRIYANKLVNDYTEYTSTVEFLTSYGSAISLGAAASKKIDIDTLCSFFMTDIMSDSEVNRKIPYVTGDEIVEEGFGGTYIEINLTTQHLFCYVDGNLVVDCDIVSGCVARDYATPSGVFKIRYKKETVTLKGAGYSTDAAYWMPFNGGIGLCDASWRNAFGGEIYLTDGSCGSINMPREAAELVYQHAFQGMYVILYGGEYSASDVVIPAQTESAPVETAANGSNTVPGAVNTNTTVTVGTETPADTEGVPSEAETEAQTELPSDTENVETDPVVETEAPAEVPAETEEQPATEAVTEEAPVENQE